MAKKSKSKKSAAMKAYWVKRRRAKEIAEAFTSPAPAPAELEFKQIDHRDTDARGSVLEHCNMAVINGFETIKRIAEIASQAPDLRTTLRKEIR